MRLSTENIQIISYRPSENSANFQAVRTASPVHVATISLILVSVLPNIWQEGTRTAAVPVKGIPILVPCLPPFC